MHALFTYCVELYTWCDTRRIVVCVTLQEGRCKQEQQQ